MDARLALVLALLFSSSHAIYLNAPTGVYGWGYNYQAQLGNGVRSAYQYAQKLQVPVAGQSNRRPLATQVSASASHTLARLSDGTVLGWGFNGKNQLGASGQSLRYFATPVDSLVSSVTSVAASDFASYFLTLEGDIQRTNASAPNLIETLPRADNRNYSGVACGGSFCAAFSFPGADRTLSELIRYWSHEPFYVISPNLPTQAASPTSVSSDPILEVAIGAQHVVFRHVYSIRGYFNQLPLGSFIYTDINNASLETRVAACFDYTVALVNGSVIGWGLQGVGFDLCPTSGVCDITSYFSTPQQLKDISCASNVIFALYYNGSIVSWNTGGTMDPLAGHSFTPGQFTIIERFPLMTKSLARSSSTAASMFALGSELPSPGDDYSSTLVAWGENKYGQLCNHEHSYASLPIETQPDLQNGCLPATVKNAFFSFCQNADAYSIGNFDQWTGIKPNNTLWLRRLEENLKFRLMDTSEDCIVFANGTSGAVQIASLGPDTSPVRLNVTLPSLDILTALECGYQHCVLYSTFNGESRFNFWGTNTSAQLPPPVIGISGNPALFDFSYSSYSTISGSLPPLIALGRDHTVFFSNITGQVRLWGDNTGLNWQRDPVDNAYYTTFTSHLLSAMVAGYRHTLVLADGDDAGAHQIFAWGDNSKGQLGASAPWRVDRIYIVPSVTLGATWTQIAAIGDTSFAVESYQSEGRVYAWGANTDKLLLGVADVHDFAPSPVPLTIISKYESQTPEYVSFEPYLCNMCKDQNMVVRMVVRARSAPSALFSAPVSSPVTPALRPHRISFGRNVGSLGIGHINSPALPTLVPLGFNDPSSPPNISSFAIGHGVFGSSFIVTPNAMNIPRAWKWTALSEEYVLSGNDPFVLPGTALRAFPHSVAVPNSNFAHMSGGGILTAIIDNSGHFYNETLDQWSPIGSSTESQLRSGSTPPGLTPTQWFLVSRTEQVNSSSPGILAALNGDAATDIVFLASDSIFGLLVNGTMFIFNGTLGTVDRLDLVTSFSASSVSLVMIRKDNTVWTIIIKARYAGESFKDIMCRAGRTDGSDPFRIHRVFMPAPTKIIQVMSNYDTSFALDNLGSVFAWGLGIAYGFGLPTAVPYRVPTLIPWTPSGSGIDPSMQILRMTSDGLRSVHFWVSYRVANNSASVCTTASPGPSFVCVDGIWQSYLPVSNVTLTLTGVVVVNGDVSVGGDIIVEGGGSLISTGCVVINGSVIISLTQEEIDAIIAAGGRDVALVQAACGDLRGQVLLVAPSPQDSCKSLTVATQETSDTSSYTLSGLFQISDTCGKDKKSNLWWIILVSVLCSVILLAIIIALLATFTPLKRIVRPFTKRNAESA